MRVEAADDGVYTTEWNESYPRPQLLTVGDLLDGTCVSPPQDQARQQAFR